MEIEQIVNIPFTIVYIILIGILAVVLTVIAYALLFEHKRLRQRQQITKKRKPLSIRKDWFEKDSDD